MNLNITLHRLETGLVFMLGMVIFVSKSLIYLSILLLIGVTLVRIASDPDYRHRLFESKLFWVSTGVFVFGLLSTVVGSGYAEDVLWMFGKTMLLPMIVPLILIFAHKTNRTATIAGAVVGFWIAFVLTGNLHNWTWSGGRYAGATWLIDHWGVICALLVLLLTPLAFVATENKMARGILVLTLLGAVVMLLINGARGPWLGVFAGVLIYLAIKQRKALLILAPLSLAAIFATSHYLPKQVEALKHRAESITDFETNASSYLRLAMWETGYALITKQLVTGDKGFWFGNRKQGKSELPNDFYYNEFIDQAKVRPGVLKEYNWHLVDFHNAYLESVFRNGVVWTLGALLILAWLAIGPLQRAQGWSANWVAVPCLIGFLVICMTYTLLPHYGFLFVIFFMALGRGFDQ